jgi:hypothetical protein
MVSGAIAFAGTMAIGAAARQYFLRGGSIDDAKQAFTKAKSAAEDEGKKEEQKMSNGVSNGTNGAGKPHPPPPPPSKED